MSQTLDVSHLNYSPSQSKDRNSSSTGVSQDSNDFLERINSIELEFSNLKISSNNNFQPEISQPQITSKLHKKAIHILMNICWDRDMDQDCLFSALMIFYSYRAKYIIKKTQLQLTIAVCILLGSKLFNPGKLGMKDLIQITNGKYSTDQFKQTESKILLVLDFDLYPNSSFDTILESFELSQEERNEVFCLMQILLLKNSDVFWKGSVLINLVKMVIECYQQDSIEVKNHLTELVKSKQGEFILRKYSSKIDTEKLRQKLLRN